MDHVARSEVLAGVLVQCLVEAPDQLFEDRAHGRVVDQVGVQIDALEPLHHLKQQTRLVELADGVVEVEFLQHLAHVLAEAGDVVPEVGGELRRVCGQLVEVVAGGVVELEARGDAELPVQGLQAALCQFRLTAQHRLLRGGEDAVEPAQHGQRQNDVLILPALEAVADQVRDTPKEADYFTVFHRVVTPCSAARVAHGSGVCMLRQRNISLPVDNGSLISAASW